MKKHRKHFLLPLFLLTILVLPLFLRPNYVMAEGETQTTAEETTSAQTETQTAAQETISVQAENISSYAAESEIIVPSPTNVQISSDDTDITLSWDNMGSDYYYIIDKSTDENWTNDHWEVYDNTFTFSSLAVGEKHTFRVRTAYDCDVDEYDEDGFLIGSTFKTVYSDWSDVVSVSLSYEAPNVTSVKSSGAVQVTLTWEAVPGASGYRIYRSTVENKGFTRIKTITSGDTLSYTDKKELVTGTKYYYKICTYNEEFTYPRGICSQAFSATPMPSKLKLTAENAGYNSIKLSWNTEKGITGYFLYRSESEDGTFTRIKTIKDSGTTTYTNTKLTTGKTYYYKVKAYSSVDGTNYKGLASAAATASPAVSAPTISSIKLAGITKATLTWNKISGASGYVVYRATSKNGTYKRLAKITDGSTVTYTATGLTNGKTYYFKVRAYRTIDGHNYCGSCSAAKKKLMNKLAYAGEPYENRCKRIWGTDYYKDYTSSSEAKADMKTITVKTWDINSSGKKYTRSFELTVHKNIASTVQQIFKEIYNGDEKFPIHSVGGYSWRGDSSSSEHCEGLAIDINPDENYMISKTDGTILSGSLYEPGKNPYSIPEDGDVVKAFEKYGFYWGDWSTKRDYMHFSYFGN